MPTQDDFRRLEAQLAELRESLFGPKGQVRHALKNPALVRQSHWANGVAEKLKASVRLYERLKGAPKPGDMRPFMAMQAIAHEAQAGHEAAVFLLDRDPAHVERALAEYALAKSAWDKAMGRENSTPPK